MTAGKTSHLRRWTAVAAAVPALVWAGGTAPAVAGATGSGTVPRAVKIARTIRNPAFAGYSLNPRRGMLKLANATWHVPRVGCQKTGNQRTAVWVGLWGDKDAVNSGHAWLPQIGTDSQCHGGQARYFIVYQLFHENSQLCALFPEWLYERLCKGTKPIEVDSPAIKPGDEIQSFVSYQGKDSSGRLVFQLDLTDYTRGKYFDKTVKTRAGVPLSHAAAMGGAEVEDQDSHGGLAKFGQVKLSMSVSGGSRGYDAWKWNLKVKKTRLAAATALIHKFGLYNWTVQWEHWS